MIITPRFIKKMLQTNMNTSYTIRTMSRKELDIAVSWAAAEGWNPGLSDTDCFYATDPHGFFMGFLGNKPISCISAVAYDDSFGFLGFYIVHPEYRGKGYGIQMWNHAIAYLGNRAIGLDGVVAQQENYKKSGFKLAYRNIRHQGSSKKFNVVENRVIPLSQIPFADLLRYDTTLFPVSRELFLKKWIAQPHSTAVGFVENGELKGYGMIRPCVTGYKIGPLFTDNATMAEHIFLALNNAVEPNSTIFLDTPEPNTEAVALAHKYKMNPMFETARMYTGQQPQIEINKIFGVTSFELG